MPLMAWLSLAFAIVLVWRVVVVLFTPAINYRLIELAARGVEVSVVLPGLATDQRWVRYASRRMWGELLEAGIRIHEYRGAMMHAKVLIVDGEWAVLGTTNVDNRSFEHNDDVNVAMRDAEVAARLMTDYRRDVADSDEITLARWQARPVWEKVIGPFIWILERQQ